MGLQAPASYDYWAVGLNCWSVASESIQAMDGFLSDFVGDEGWPMS